MVGVVVAGVLKYACGALTALSTKEPSMAAAVAEALRSFRVVEMAQAALPHHAPAAPHPQLTKAYERLAHHVQTLTEALG